jgi:DNA repair protein RadA
LKKNSGYDKIDYEDENEILSSTRKRAHLGGLNSLTSIAIQGPVKVAEKLQVSLEDSYSLCRVANERLEQSNQIHTSFSTAKNFLSKRENLPRLSTGSQSLDKLLLGGVECGSVTEIFGSPGTGKTQLCFTLCTMLNKNNSEQSPIAIYIDTEKKFRPERLKQIAIARGYNPNILEKVLLIIPLNSSHFETLLTQTLNMIEKESSIRLLIIDSVVALYRSEFTGRKNLLERQKRITELMKVLVNASAVHNVAVVITNQTQSSVDLDWGNKLKPVGGNVIGHMSTYRLELKNTSIHVASIINSPYHDISEARFMISEKGITDC